VKEIFALFSSSVVVTASEVVSVAVVATGATAIVFSKVTR